MLFTILHFDMIGSTNAEALEQARRGAAEGLCVTAGEQTAGRGRYGRKWISEKGAGLYASVVLRPPLAPRFLPLITLMSAVAVYETIAECGVAEVDIKWVNDIHVREKKICGILAETCETANGLAVVAGIGINLKSTNFPPEIAEIATSLEAETGKAFGAPEILEKLTRNLSVYCDLLYGEDGAEKIRAAWTQRSSYAYGKRVKVLLENETFAGETCGIEENGALRVRTETGEIRVVHAGDVENLRKI